MKFLCHCGHLIVDQTDALPHKAHLIADTDWHPFWDAIDEAIEDTGKDAKEKEATCMQLRRQHTFRLVYVCPNCGRLYLDGPGGRLRSYKPEGD